MYRIVLFFKRHTIPILVGVVIGVFANYVTAGLMSYFGDAEYTEAATRELAVRLIAMSPKMPSINDGRHLFEYIDDGYEAKKSEAGDSRFENLRIDNLIEVVREASDLPGYSCLLDQIQYLRSGIPFFWKSLPEGDGKVV